MYTGLTHAHSGLRWIVLLFLVLALITAYRSWKGQKAPSKMPLFALIATHTQLLIGLVLYFISPLVSFGEGFMKNDITRFYSVEHISVMLIAIILITIGYSKGKRQPSNEAKGKTIFTYYLIGLILILVSIPWPFRGLGAGWF
jgi:membrane protein DedA with SNARE-associated domain